MWKDHIYQENVQSKELMLLSVWSFPLSFPTTWVNFYDVTDMLTLLYAVVEFNIVFCDFIY